MNIVKAVTKLQKIAILTYCEMNEAWFHTGTMSGEQFEEAYGDSGRNAPDSNRWRVIPWRVL